MEQLSQCMKVFQFDHYLHYQVGQPVKSKIKQYAILVLVNYTLFIFQQKNSTRMISFKTIASNDLYKISLLLLSFSQDSSNKHTEKILNGINIIA